MIPIASAAVLAAAKSKKATAAPKPTRTVVDETKTPQPSAPKTR